MPARPAAGLPPTSPVVALTSLRILVAALSQSARAVETRTGITNAQLFLLRRLAAAEALSVNDLAEQVHTRQNTVSSVVGRLVRAGLVAKVRSPDDRRRAALSLTPKGRRLLARASMSPTETLLASLETLSPRDLRALTHGLDALIAAMGLDVEHAPMLFERLR